MQNSLRLKAFSIIFGFCGRYQELLRLTEGKRLVVVPTFEVDNMALAHLAASGVHSAHFHGTVKVVDDPARREALSLGRQASKLDSSMVSKTTACLQLLQGMRMARNFLTARRQ